MGDLLTLQVYCVLGVNLSLASWLSEADCWYCLVDLQKCIPWGELLFVYWTGLKLIPVAAFYHGDRTIPFRKSLWKLFKFSILSLVSHSSRTVEEIIKDFLYLTTVVDSLKDVVCRDLIFRLSINWCDSILCLSGII